MSRRRRKKLPTTPLELEISALSHEGRGIAHHEGKVVFVEGALPGEKVEAVLTDRRSKYDQAKLVEVHSPSPDRIEPACEYASICGGCSLQHFDPRAQLAFKESMLFEKLDHAVQGQQYTHMDPLRGPVLGYRRKARLAVRYVHKKEQVLVGFREKGSTFITNMSSCEVLDQRVSSMLPALSALVSSLESFREIPQIEVAAGDPDLDAPTTALVFRHLKALGDADQEKLVSFARENSFALYLQPGGMDTVHKVHPKSGPDRLYYHLPAESLALGFHPTDFTQVNADINRLMIGQALQLLELQQDDRLLDLFSGLGNFTLAAARRCQHVTGVEGSQAMVERGMENARLNNISNTEFHSADLTQPMAKAPWLQNTFNKVLLDPPRSGCFEILSDLIQIRPQRIVYVSCNPATLARDAAFLAEQGYRLSSAGVMDMFPQTAHVEAMALFVEGKAK